jgi:hypothetical protein
MCKFELHVYTLGEIITYRQGMTLHVHRLINETVVESATFHTVYITSVGCRDIVWCVVIGTRRMDISMFSCNMFSVTL